MSKNYNKEKINNFLSKNYSYYFDEKRGNSYILNKDGFPVSAILTSKYIYEEKSGIQENYYNIGMHYSSENLGKIHYYLLMMHLNQKKNSYLKPTLYEELTEITNNIWNSILNDKSVNKKELDSEEDYEFGDVPEIENYAFNKIPDELYDKTLKKQNNYFKNHELCYLEKVCTDIFNEIYIEGYEKDEIEELIKEEAKNFLNFKKQKRKLKV